MGMIGMSQMQVGVDFPDQVGQQPPAASRLLLDNTGSMQEDGKNKRAEDRDQRPARPAQGCRREQW